MTRYFKELDITIQADVAIARHCAGQMARELDFPAQRHAEVRLIASELAQNHLDHRTTRGKIQLSGLFLGTLPCLTIVSQDHGPGIDDIDSLLFQEPCRQLSTTGLGAGLASARRLADSFSICSATTAFPVNSSVTGEPVVGTRIVARCWPKRRKPDFLTGSQTDVCGLVAPRSETLPRGDDIFITGDSRFLRIVMVDSPGLGKGGELTRVIGEHLGEIDLVWPPEQILESLETNIADGVALHVVLFDRLRQRLCFAGIGNISVYFFVDGECLQPTVQAMLIGYKWPRFTSTEYAVDSSCTCLLHTDGVAPFAGKQLKRLFRDFESRQAVMPLEGGLDISFFLQLAFSRKWRRLDDAALCMGRWQI